MERSARGKRTTLFSPFVSGEENSFITLKLGFLNGRKENKSVFIAASATASTLRRRYDATAPFFTKERKVN
jgi:hypothetical protein